MNCSTVVVKFNLLTIAKSIPKKWVAAIANSTIQKIVSVKDNE